MSAQTVTTTMTYTLTRSNSTRVPGHAVLALGGVLLLLLAAGCKQDPFEYVTDPSVVGQSDGGAEEDGGGSTTDGGNGNGDGGGDGDGGCEPTEEICDGKDNDCNGTIDDVAAAKLTSDVENCGKCGTKCVVINAFAKCEAGTCALDTCAPGYYDINNKEDDGCEYQCQKSNGGVEECPSSNPNCSCDNTDNDCDGEIDEGFDKQTDVNNCGACGTKCLYNAATPVCNAGKCEMGKCDDGFVDLNTDDKDGCEYKCPVWPIANETCNGKDDDCDGLIDEGLPGAGVACDTGLLGECKAGTTQCSGGSIQCIGNKVASAEKCDKLDNDCDGSIDEDFNLQTNPQNCGTCGKVCSYANGTPKCVAGVCQLDKCQDGYANLNTTLTDGCEHQCEVFPLSAEKCNGKDDDCDKQVDEDFNLQTDVNHCGQCGKQCSYLNAQAICENGGCKMGTCATNFFDANNSDSDGCEYFCVLSNGGTEACDGVDNDCDNKIDEDFNKATDVNNCGICGKKCVFNNGTASCLNSNCVLTGCTAGFKDLDNLSANGCEYKCPVFPAGTTDPCDGIDNDCDGQVDEDFTSGSCGTNVGECQAGTTSCVGGNVVCNNSKGPTAEICDGKDNDCANGIDNGFDKLNDPRYCGNCVACNLPHAIANCTNGVCGIAACEQGWVDLDNNPATGCEYNCTPTGVELCDGLDNDCNGKTDTLDPGMVPLGGNPCVNVAGTLCASATASCQGSLGWICNYPSSVELKTCTTDADCNNIVPCTSNVCPGVIASDETLCDNIDNDCDTQADEPFTNKNQACFESGKQGVCQGTGTFVCTSDKKGTQCNITTAGIAPSNETCDGLDNDCDGKVDEETDNDGGNGFLGVTDAMVRIQRTYNAVNYDFYIYTYEASRPDSKPGVPGNNAARACSKAGVIPWANADYATAKKACEDAGKRLCTATEWFLACSGAPPAKVFPYGNTYGPTTCNGKNNDADGNGANGITDAVVNTGSKTQCVATGNIYDLSGNLREWTNDPQNQPCTSVADCPAGSTSCTGGFCVPTVLLGHTVRGGGYDTTQNGLRCDSTFAVFPPAFSFPNLGFRCCSNTAP